MLSLLQQILTCQWLVTYLWPMDVHGTRRYIVGWGHLNRLTIDQSVKKFCEKVRYCVLKLGLGVAHAG